ncbi:hypothetical protein KC19_12G015100 [Ceratodon purpureus]|uniref:Pyruvate phosphate dikinase AMP/ATP-binding domain-containing protein n=1 Tax=Ceratodon purpureus TaxID=3225 RepID=A0A8T0G6I0_CERPU|nr:hypothetical protein KC19_12G015100 [Ceratodon purpureus]
MQSHGVLSRPNSVSCVAVPGVCLGEFTQCKCSAAPVLSSSSSRCLKGGLQSSFVSRTSNFLVPNSSKGGIRRVERRAVISPRAMVATAVEVAEITKEFTLDHGIKLKVKATGAAISKPASLQFEVSNCHVDSLFLHWGALQPGKNAWNLPASRPEGSYEKHGAVQSPFHKTGDTASVTIDFPDFNLNVVEFLLVDRNRNYWYKLNGQNFRVDIPQLNVDLSGFNIPEELVGIQSYLRWERRGRQNYSFEQEKAEYEEARKELQMEVAQGVSISKIRARLQGRQVEEEKQEKQESSGNGKPKLDQAGSQSRKGGVQKLPRISRKKWSTDELFNRFTPGAKAGSGTSAPPKEPTALQKAAQKLEAVDGGSVILKQFFKAGNEDLLVLVTKAEGKVHVRMGTNFKGPLVIRWAVSKDHAREWAPPPETVIPAESTLVNGTVDTQFKEGFAEDASLQGITIDLGENNFVGLPFVMHSGGNWYKDNGSDYYVSVRPKDKKAFKALGDGKGTAKDFLQAIASQESEAERSLMHRYNIATGLTERAKNEGELAQAGILVWLRFMATRQLVWNKNYNVKPREISAAQDRLTYLLQKMFAEQHENREMIRLIMGTVGRGGEGDVGQRIRDEILVIQRNNDCKGGMMEEWHQKLHNNTSPDDVVICQALLDYIKSGFDMKVYWKTLNDNGVTKERMLSYDRPVRSEPKFKADQKDGLIRDLTHYLRTLKAVHSGADLESAIQTCMGYTAKASRHMGDLKIHPISGLSGALPQLLEFVLDRVEDKDVMPLLEGLLEARRELRPTLLKPHDRLRDIIFLDLALDSTVRTAVERGLEALNSSGPLDLALIISMVVENLALSSNNNEELVYCLKDWYHVTDTIKNKSHKWALRTKAVLDRTRLALQDKAEYYQKVLQPTAEYLGSLLGVEEWAVNIFTEEMIRSGSAASLSLLLNRLDPVIRKEANMGSWQVISPVDVKGFIEVVDELEHVQDKVYDRPTILVSGRVKGEEEIPDGAVAVLTPDMPDVLSHVSVRARNGKICFATCFDPNVLADLRKNDKKAVSIQITPNADLSYSGIGAAEVASATAADDEHSPPPKIILKKKKFVGKYAISADEFTSDLVGAKSRNIANLRGKLPSWIRLPTSVALPFGVFEKILAEATNKDVATKIASLSKQLAAGDFSKLKDARATVLGLKAPPALIEELKKTLKGSGMPWPGDESEERWTQAWTAIKRVWASKWNERAYFSTRKAKIDHSDLCMAVLVQEIIQADYAFVIHTTNPSTEDETEIYAEVVKGLGETLVGAYSGRALSFIAKKSDIKNPKVLGYPSKRVGLFIKQSIIFRSDSNGEDLEGYAGAGLYDSVPMDVEEERVVDYSSDHLILDEAFQKTILTKIAEAGYAVEKLLGSAQDIEGVIKDGELYIVQTRPQM